MREVGLEAILGDLDLGLMTSAVVRYFVSLVANCQLPTGLCNSRQVRLLSTLLSVIFVLIYFVVLVLVFQLFFSFSFC